MTGSLRCPTRGGRCNTECRSEIETVRVLGMAYVGSKIQHCLISVKHVC